MDMEKLKPFAVPVAIFLVLAIAAVLMLKAWTSSPSIIRVEVVTRVTNAAAQQSQEVVAAEAQASGDLNPVTAQLETYQQSVFSGLASWAAVLFTAGAFFAMLWTVHSARKQRSVYGPAGQGSAMGAWVLTALVLAASIAAAYFYFLVPLDLTQFITPGSLTLVAGATALVAFAGYWLATFLAASPVMRPSVPFSFPLTR